MVACMGGYYRASFKGLWGVTEVDPLSPHHILYGGGCSGMTLDLIGGRGSVRVGRVGKVGATLRRIFLRGLWPV